MRNFIMVLGAAGLLAGCGEAKQGFDDGFNTKFHESFVESCVSSAVQSGTAKDVATRICNCASDEVKKRFSVREKMSLKNEQLTPIVQRCATLPA